MLHGGNDIKTVMVIAGKSPEIILQTYAHASSLSKSAIINSLPGLYPHGVLQGYKKKISHTR